MNKNRKFAISAVAFCIALVICSCEPDRACAVEIGISDQSGIYDYLNAGQTGLVNLDFQLDEDEDGNRSTRVKIYALQKLAFQEQTTFYDNLDFSGAPDTMTVSGGGGVGYYRSHKDGNSHLVTVYSLPPYLPDYGTTTSLSYTLCSSDEFTVSARVSGSIQYTSSLPDSNYSAFGGYNLRRDPENSDTSTFTLTATGDYFNFSSKTLSGNLSSYSYWNGYKCTLYNSSGAPLLSASAFSEVVNASFLPVNFAPTVGNGQGVQLPSGTIDTEKPWDYYNNILLPYMEEEYPEYTDLFVFPDGYQPPEQPTTIPIEYPTLPGYDLGLSTDATAPVSEYNYGVPELPGKDVAVPAFDFSQINPAEVMAPVSSGLRAIWTLVTSACTEFNLFPYIGFAIFAAIVVGLLHLGK